MQKRHLLISVLVLGLFAGIMLWLLDRYVISLKSVNSTVAHAIGGMLSNQTTDRSVSQADMSQLTINPPQPISTLSADAWQDDLRSRIEVNEQVSDPIKRDVTYQEIVTIALEHDRPDLARETAKKIEGSDSRNTAYEHIIQQAIKHEDFSLANQLSGEIDDVARKNAAQNKILTANPI